MIKMKIISFMPVIPGEFSSKYHLCHIFENNRHCFLLAILQKLVYIYSRTL